MNVNVKIGTAPLAKNTPPSHSVYLVKDKDGEAVFEKVGAMWPHADDNGFNQALSFYDWDITLLIRQNN